MVSTNAYLAIAKKKLDLGNNSTWRSLWSTVRHLQCFSFSMNYSKGVPVELGEKDNGFITKDRELLLGVVEPVSFVT